MIAQTATAPAYDVMARHRAAADEEPLSCYRDRVAIAHGVALDLLYHDLALGPDIHRLVHGEFPQGPGAANAIAGLLFEIVDVAAEAAYRLASTGILDTLDLDLTTHSDVARAMAAIMRRPTWEDGEPMPDDEAFPHRP